MKVLIVVGNSVAGAVFDGLTRACRRSGQVYLCFFTGDGVKLLSDSKLQEGLMGAERAVVCEHSWAQYHPELEPPVEQGSQTDHSAMVGLADRLVSL